jgi:tetratricopeptide (TPR) repeat protein
MWDECQRLRRGTLGPDHRDTLATLTNLAVILSELGRHADALPHWRELAAARERAAAGSWQAAEAQSRLGGCLAALGRRDEAEPLLLATYERLAAAKGIPAAQAYRPEEALRRVIALYEAWGKPDEAAKWRARLPPQGPAAPAK